MTLGGGVGGVQVVDEIRTAQATLDYYSEKSPASASASEMLAHLQTMNKPKNSPLD